MVKRVLHEIRAVGYDRFKEEIEALTGRRLKVKKENGLLGGGKRKNNFTLTPNILTPNISQLFWDKIVDVL